MKFNGEKIMVARAEYKMCTGVLVHVGETSAGSQQQEHAAPMPQKRVSVKKIGEKKRKHNMQKSVIW